MRYESEIVVPITLSKNVIDIQFKEKVLVSLDCSTCERSGRTVVLFKDPGESFCTPTKHAFKGFIRKLEVSERESEGLLSSKSVVTARYCIEYDYSEFMDKKYPQREIGPEPTWSRATFELKCKCGVKSVQETQNNIIRPWLAKCTCGKELYYEVSEIPIFKHTAQA